MNPNDTDHDARVQQASYENGRSHERARIVAWLRHRAAVFRALGDHVKAESVDAHLDVAAALIEEHQEPADVA